MIRVPLTRLVGEGEGPGWAFEFHGAAGILRDPSGSVVATVDAAANPPGIVLPSFSQSIKDVRIAIGGEPARFDASPDGVKALREFLRSGTLEGGPDAVRRVLLAALRDSAIGLGLLGYAVYVVINRWPVVGQGNFPRSAFACTLGGFVALGLGIWGFREHAKLKRRFATRALEPVRVSARPGATAAPGHAPAAARPLPPADRRAAPVVVAAPGRRKRWTFFRLFLLFGGGLLGLLVLLAVLPAVLMPRGRASGAPPRPQAPPGPPGSRGAAPAPPAAPPRVREASAGEAQTPGAATPRSGSRRPIVSGAIELVNPPPSVRPDATVSTKKILLFAESQRSTLRVPVACDLTAPGELRAGAAGPGGAIAAGVRVNSHFLHANSAGAGGVVKLEGTVVFPAEVLGIVQSGANLDASDRALGLGAVAYPSGGQFRGWLDGDAGDSITLMADRRTVRVRSHTGRWVDQIRVITAADDP